MATITGGHHIAVTVQEADRSAAWYQAVLGMQVLLQGDEEPCDSGCWRIRTRDGSSACARTAAARTAPRRLPLRPRHFAFGMSSGDDLQAWKDRLRELDVPLTPPTETPIGTVMVFRDPDNIQLELWLPASG